MEKLKKLRINTQADNRMDIILAALQTSFLHSKLGYVDGIVAETQKDDAVAEVNRYYIQEFRSILTKGLELASRVAITQAFDKLERKLHSNLSIQETLFSSTSDQELMDAAEKLGITKCKLCEDGKQYVFTASKLRDLMTPPFNMETTTPAPMVGK